MVKKIISVVCIKHVRSAIGVVNGLSSICFIQLHFEHSRFHPLNSNQSAILDDGAFNML